MVAVVRFREFWGVSKRTDLLEKLDDGGNVFEASYAVLVPDETNRFSFRTSSAVNDYTKWPTVHELASVQPLNGPVERRGMALIDVDRTVLQNRMRAYFDSSIGNAAIAQLQPSLMMTGNRIVGPDARRKLLAETGFDQRHIVRLPWKPFDTRWCYLANIRPLFSEPSPDLIANAALAQQAFFITRDDADTPNEGPPSYFSCTAVDYDLLRGHARHFAVVVRQAAKRSKTSTGFQQSLFGGGEEISCPNLSLAANAAGIRQGWPRIPLPAAAAALHASSGLGEQVAALLDPDAPVPGVTASAIRPELAAIAVPATLPGAARDWSLTGWGNRTDKGITMPGRGHGHGTVRNFTPAEAATAAHAALLGARTRDVGMNAASLWRNIPEQVWETHIGGYQVLKKWLSYRDASILKRPLTPAEVGHVTATARRLAALRLLGPALDAAHHACTTTHTPLNVQKKGG